ncbi:uncharacterized protein LOC108101374 [Drosophila ficusphila]|uniref:uncharacterized protein LOC108101374 n=1 Tax=Drosophila ficusphila TaxID=30025 RepID=UPI001C89D0E5|nr:uncharacterized protein LOC108101374 [Drosophila ficusphila]
MHRHVPEWHSFALHKPHLKPDKIIEYEATNYPAEFLNSLDVPGTPPHNLQLKLQFKKSLHIFTFGEQLHVDGDNGVGGENEKIGKNVKSNLEEGESSVKRLGRSETPTMLMPLLNFSSTCERHINLSKQILWSFGSALQMILF